MKMIVYLFSLIAIMGSACKKDVAELKPQTPVTGDKNKLFLKDVKSDAQSEYFISGEFDGYKIYNASTFTNLYPDNDTRLNAIYFNKAINLDNIYLIRENSEMSVTIAMYFMNTNIFTRKFPYNIPHPNLDYCENVQIDLINRRKVGTVGQGSPNDDFTFRGHTNSNIKVQVISLVENIMEGTFEGTLATKTGSIIRIKDGKFRIKIKAANTGNEGKTNQTYTAATSSHRYGVKSQAYLQKF